MQAKHRIITYLVCINIGLLFLFYYFPLLSSGYVWDDIRIYKSILPTPDTLETSYQPPFFQSSNFFRPLGYLVFILEVNQFGIDPRISHGINIFIHTSTMWMLFWIIMTVCRTASVGEKIAVASAITIFIGTLPTMAEPSSWISARFESICAFFIACLVRTQISGISINLKVSLFYALMLAAISSKEMAITFIPSYIILHTLLHWSDIKKYGFIHTFNNRTFSLPFLSLLASMATYWLIRFALTDSSFLTVNTQSNISIENHTRLILDSLENYGVMLAWPWVDLKPFYFPDYAKPLSFLEILLLAAVPTIIAAAIYNSIRHKQRAWLLPLLFATNILPAANVIPIFPELFSVSTRYIYIPILMCTIAVVIIYSTPEKQSNSTYLRIFLAAAIPAMLVGNFVGTRNFIAHYETDEIFWEHVASTTGVHHSITAINIINSKLAQYKYSEAETLINRHKHLFSKSDYNIPIWETTINYHFDKNLDKSIAALEQLIANGSTKPEIKTWSYNMTALILARQCRVNESILDAARNALRISDNALSHRIIEAIQAQQNYRDNSLIPGQEISLHKFQLEALQRTLNILQEDLDRCSRTDPK